MGVRKVKCPFCNRVSSICCETQQQADKCVKMDWTFQGGILVMIILVIAMITIMIF